MRPPFSPRPTRNPNEYPQEPFVVLVDRGDGWRWRLRWRADPGCARILEPRGIASQGGEQAPVRCPSRQVIARHTRGPESAGGWCKHLPQPPEVVASRGKALGAERARDAHIVVVHRQKVQGDPTARNISVRHKTTGPLEHEDRKELVRRRHLSASAEVGADDRRSVQRVIAERVDGLLCCTSGIEVHCRWQAERAVPSPSTASRSPRR